MTLLVAHLAQLWHAAIVVAALLCSVTAAAAGARTERQARSLLADAAPSEGCYVDRKCAKQLQANGTFPNLGKRDLAYITQDNFNAHKSAMTRYKCAVLAKANNDAHKYAALQHGRECFAAKTTAGLQRADAAKCDEVCTAARDEVCGGTCHNTIYPISESIKVQWTKSTNQTERTYDEYPEVCPEGQYIQSWDLGLGAETVTQEPTRLLSITGICGNGIELLPAIGTTQPSVHMDAEAAAELGSGTGFTCSMLQAGGATAMSGTIKARLEVFLGQGAAPSGVATKPLALCATGADPTWVAIGYKRQPVDMTGEAIGSIQFLMAPRGMVGLPPAPRVFVPAPVPPPRPASPSPAPPPPPTTGPTVININNSAIANNGNVGNSNTGNNNGNNGKPAGNKDRKTDLSDGEIGGIVSGVIAGLTLVAAALLIIKRTAVIQKLCGNKAEHPPAPPPAPAKTLVPA